MAADPRVADLVRTLELSCDSLEADIARINLDLKYQEECYARYNSEAFVASIRYLMGLRDDKKMQFRLVIEKLEGLKHNIETSSLLMSQIQSAKAKPVLQVNIIRSNAPTPTPSVSMTTLR